MIDKRATPAAAIWRLEPARAGIAAVPLAAASSATFGRDPSCDVVFDASFGGISRKHATVSVDGSGLRVTDLGSSNGTFVNGARVAGSQPLRAGDRLSFADDATFVVRAEPKVIRPGGALTDQPRFISELLPFLSRRDQGASLRRYLLPSILIALGVVTLFVTGATAHQGTYLAVVAAFLGFGALAIIDALARHPRPWWILIAAAIVTAVVLLWPQSPIEALDFHIFRDLLPGRPQENAPPSLELFVAYFFGAGCAEESLKAIPVLLALGLVLLRRGKFGPLDGLVIGAASGLGFTLVETLGQYVPQAMAHVEAEEGPLAGAFAGVELEIPRLVGALTGHMAWAGYLGYAIGAAAATTNATRRMQLVLGGFAIAAALHALWDTVDLNAGAVSQFIATTIGVASFLLLASAAARGRFAAAPAPAPEAPK